MTATTLRICLILASMGMKELTIHSRTPTTISVTRTVINGMWDSSVALRMRIRGNPVWCGPGLARVGEDHFSHRTIRAIRPIYRTVEAQGLGGFLSPAGAGGDVRTYKRRTELQSMAKSLHRIVQPGDW